MPTMLTETVVNTEKSSSRERGGNENYFVKKVLYQFPRAAVRNYYELGGLRTTEINFLTVLETRTLKSMCQQGFFLKALGRIPLSSLSFRWLQAFSGLGPICLHLHILIFFMSVSSSFLLSVSSLLRTLATGLQVYPNPRITHLKVLSFYVFKDPLSK